MTVFLALLVIFAQVAQSVVWQRYDVDLVLQSDGSLAVTETQSITFQGSFHEGFRSVPTDHTTGITDVHVYDADTGEELDHGTNRTLDSVDIDWTFPSVTNGTKTFKVQYTAHGATRIYPEGDQVDWNAIYANRNGPVQASTVTLHLPADVSPSDVRTAMYTYGDNQPSREVGQGSVVDARTIRWVGPALPAQTGLEVRAQVPSSMLPGAQPPLWQAQVDRQTFLTETVAPIGAFVVLLLTALIVVGGGVGLFLLWYARGREPNVGEVPPTLAAPPSDLPAPLVGTLVDGVADVQDAVAIMVDLAQRHVLDLTSVNGDVRVGLHVATQDPTLHPWERVLLVALFGVGKSEGQIMLSGARTSFAAAVPILQERLHEGVAQAGLFAGNPEATRRKYRNLGFVMVGVGLLGSVVLGVALSVIPAVWLPGLALALLGGVLVWIAPTMPRRTQRGQLEAKRWLAFKHHLQSEEKVPDTHLPYAVALGIDRDFVHRLELQGAPVPTWYAPSHRGGYVYVPGPYYGGGHHHDGGPSGSGVGPVPEIPNPQGWSDGLAALLSAASEAMAAGGGSGGWSGGGFGGGGGGGGGSGGFR